jgi:hypothetical protein
MLEIRPSVYPYGTEIIAWLTEKAAVEVTAAGKCSGFLINRLPY